MADKLNVQKYCDTGTKIADLKPGGMGGYVTPWNMLVLPNGGCYINPKVRVRPDRKGTANLYVTRTDVGLLVDVTKVASHMWPISESVPDNYERVVRIIQ